MNDKACSAIFASATLIAISIAFLGICVALSAFWLAISPRATPPESRLTTRYPVWEAAR